MKVKCHKLQYQNSIFFWEEDYVASDKFGNPIELKRKVFKNLSLDEEFDVPDAAGHALLAKYPDNLRVVRYGDDEPQQLKKMVSTAPKVKEG